MRTLIISVAALLLIVARVNGQADAPTTQPAPDWTEVLRVFDSGTSIKDGVLTAVVPRTDLAVSVDGIDVPTAAGMQSVFHFYACACGKKNVLGQFVLAQYEVNDVIDALRAGNIQVASVAPLLLNERPRVMVVRFQGEGDALSLAKTLKVALGWTGDARVAPAK